ncbi:MAG: hypothetical protein AAFY15_02035, partial [Cyanobacteria bacterium J06648_11]
RVEDFNNCSIVVADIFRPPGWGGDADDIGNNAAESPLVVSDIGDEYTNTGDAIALSHDLNDDVSFLLLSTEPDLSELKGDRPTFAFRPSGRVRAALEAQNWQLTPLIDDNELYQLQMG